MRLVVECSVRVEEHHISTSPFTMYHMDYYDLLTLASLSLTSNISVGTWFPPFFKLVYLKVSSIRVSKTTMSYFESYK